MFERKMDKYYTKKIVDLIESYLRFWNIDYKFYFNDKTVEVMIKKREYKDNCYTSIFLMPYKWSLYYLINYDDEIENTIKERIEEYVKKEK